ncbi:PASTA domain-containing protein [Elizabethkingia sp. JS20170427COW]|uniref:PASTA domain-containing protein n=1 Tax=Elizabethkingia sp. JS20170427COW TaxID=2583851 RepID=UPI0011101333|nr:PASTA domain-containing protein [Elizabethkingia sp. JS20170427COW]QCX52798.1 PASTA domain-containing protein [Elizabethkingia sp. JS20170427COW]
MLKAFFNWKVWVNILLAIGVFIGLVWLTFRWLEYHTDHGKETQVPDVTNLSVQKAVEVLDNTGLAYEIDSFNFDPKYKPFQVLQIYPTPGSRVKGGSPIRLKVNPRTWAPVAIPDIIDSYKYRAYSKLNLVGLKVGDTIYEPSISKDAVLKLLYNGHPVKPGDLVPRFASIDLVIGQGPKRNVPIPNVVGRTLAEAKEIIKQNYFELGIVYDENEQPVSDPSLIIFYQNPSAGSISDQGIQIDLWASNKTPAEMHNKIKDLDSQYRRNYAPDPSYYHSEPDFSSSFDDFEEPKHVEAPKPVERKKVTPVKKAEPEKKNTEKPVEKPKEKKKVIIE